jgi:Transposase DDE domain
VQAAYGKLRRLPIALSEAFLAETTQRLLGYWPAAAGAATALPESLAMTRVVVFDGKTLKRAAKRLKPVRRHQGKGLGGRVLVAWDPLTGLILAMSADPDGHANEARLLPALLPQVRQDAKPRLWVADRQFGDVVQITRLCQHGDHFVLRLHKNTTFVPDPECPAQTGCDRLGREFRQAWGWLDSKRQKTRCYVRQITLTRPNAAPLTLVTDLLDEQAAPAQDLLELYRERWGIERVFQQVSEVFHLLHLIGSTPNAIIFQCAFCMVLYNLLQVVRALVAQTQRLPIKSISSENLFYDLRRELIGLHFFVDAPAIAAAFPSRAAQHDNLSAHLRQQLKAAWTKRWLKSKPKRKPPPSQPKTAKPGAHVSIHRAILAAKAMTTSGKHV